MLKSRYFSTRVRATRHCIRPFMPDFRGVGKGELQIRLNSAPSYQRPAQPLCPMKARSLFDKRSGMYL